MLPAPTMPIRNLRLPFRLIGSSRRRIFDHKRGILFNLEIICSAGVPPATDKRSHQRTRSPLAHRVRAGLALDACATAQEWLDQHGVALQLTPPFKSG